MSAAGSCQASCDALAAGTTLGAFPFAFLMIPLQSSRLRKYLLVCLSDLLLTQADWLPLCLVNLTRCLTASSSVLQDGVVDGMGVKTKALENRGAFVGKRGDAFAVLCRVSIPIGICYYFSSVKGS